MKHVYDFYKPELHSEYPQVDGPLSVECYLSALDICYERYRQKYEKGSQTSSTKSAQNGDAAAVQTDASVCWPSLSLQKTFDAILFHTPFCKIVQKSLGRLMLSEFLNQMPHSLNDPKFEKLAKFELVLSDVIIFRPTFSMGEEKHHLCCVFFPNFAKTPLCTTPLHLLSLPAQPSYWDWNNI